MSDDAPSKRTFSPGRKWSIAFDVVLRTVVVLAVVVMANYLAGRHFGRFYLSSQTRVELSPRTVSVLRSLTNEVTVTLYYDKDEALFSTISDLLREYRKVNPRIRIDVVDYMRDATEAQRVKEAYKLITTTEGGEKDVVIFDSEGRTRIVPGNALADVTIEPVPGSTDREIRRKLIAFKGEMMFTSMLLSVINPKPLNAYFLQNHGEHRIDSADEVSGYLKFAGVLKQNYILPSPLSLLGTNEIPRDCNLLVIAGPTTELLESEQKKIQQYLNEGGRLLALFNSTERARQTGLEKILAGWGVIVGNDTVQDPQNERDVDVIVSAFSLHPVVNPVLGSALQLILPRPVQAVKSDGRNADAPKVEEVAFTGERSHLRGNPQQTGRYAVIAAVEKGSVRGVVTERGATRILVVGDSMLFGNGMIEKWANRDFAGFAANWLLDRTQLLEGLGPKPVTEMRINLTRSQLQRIEWLLLAAGPGGVLLLGILVWFARRQ